MNERAVPPIPALQSPLAISVCIGLAALVTYWPALDNGFVNWDDDGYVYENAALALPWNEFVGWAFTSFAEANWHPLTWISLRLSVSLAGIEPRGFIAANIGLHAVNSILVFHVVRALLRVNARRSTEGRTISAALAASIFAIHPLHVESVAWISERKDVLCAVFFLASLLSWLRYVEGAGSRVRPYMLALGFFTLALLSKPMAVSLPVILLILDVHPLNRLHLDKQLFFEKLPLFALAFGSSIVTVVAQKHLKAIVTISALPVELRVGNAARSIWFYLSKFVWPTNLSPLYPLPQEFVKSDKLIMASSFCGVVALTALCFVLWKRMRDPLVLWSSFVIMLVPTLGLVQVGTQAAADRYMYLPMIAPAIATAAVALRASRLLSSRGLLQVLVIALGLFLLLAALTVRQIRTWRDSESMWSKVLELHPRSATALYNLGEHYRERGDLNRASRKFLETVDANPVHSGAQNHLGNIALLSGNTREAERRYRLALSANADNAEANYNLAITLDRRGQTIEAEAYYERFLEIGGEDFEAMFPAVERRLGHGH